MTTVSSSTVSYLNAAYGRTASDTAASTTKNTGAAATASTPSSSSATVVTLSAQAQALLSSQSSLVDIATVIADTRSALDALYKTADVAGPFDQDGKSTVDLGGLDRRALFAIANDGGETFTADEKKAAAQELRGRFDAMLSPQTAVARLSGDWSRLYKAAIDYLQAAGPEEKASVTWSAQLQALQLGYDQSVKQDGALPKGIAGDPVADFLNRNPDGSATATREFGAVAKDVRTALDAQYAAAEKGGKRLVFDRFSGSGQMADLSGLDNRALSAVSLNEGDCFSQEEVRAARKELDARTRASLLSAFKQAGDSGDPRGFSLGLVYQYSAMSAEERQAMNWGSDVQDMAVKNYQMSSNLLSMLQQSGGGSLFDYIK